MLHNIANKGHRVIIATLTAALLVALFSTKAHAEFIFKNSDPTTHGPVFDSKGNDENHTCPYELHSLLRANGYYLKVYATLKGLKNGDIHNVGELGVDALLDSETPKLKKLSDGLHDKAYEEIQKALDKTSAMLLDGCAKEIQCKDVMGGKECYYTVKVAPQDLIKNAEKYLK